MSASYSAGVFFGACVGQFSALGQALDDLIDERGGTPAPTTVPGVEIDTVGSWGTGEIWMAIRATGSAQSYGRNEGDCPAPMLLVEADGWRPAVAAFLASVGYETMAIGWHFQGSVT